MIDLHISQYHFWVKKMLPEPKRRDILSVRQWKRNQEKR